MGRLFQWDQKKERDNIEVHGLSFDETSTAFRDPLSRTMSDPLHSKGEERLVLIGESLKRRDHSMLDIDPSGTSAGEISNQLLIGGRAAIGILSENIEKAFHLWL